jgi:hypothetical protein
LVTEEQKPIIDAAWHAAHRRGEPGVRAALWDSFGRWNASGFLGPGSGITRSATSTWQRNNPDGIAIRIGNRRGIVPDNRFGFRIAAGSQPRLILTGKDEPMESETLTSGGDGAGPGKKQAEDRWNSPRQVPVF